MNAKFISWEEAVQWLKNQPDKQELVRSCYFDDPLENAADRYVKSEEWAAIKKILFKKLPGTVLDIGAGRGITSYAFANTKSKVFALEPDPSEIVGASAIQKLSKKNSSNIFVVRGIGEKLPFSKPTFDIVHGRQVLHHAKDLNNFCSEVYKVLKPGGFFIATREHVISKRGDLDAFLASHPLHKMYGREYAYSLKEYTKMLRQSGFKIIRILKPFESPINYSPMLMAEFQKHLSDRIEKVSGNMFASWISSKDWFKTAVAKTYELFDNTPGRLFTFITIKT